jgi:hypothetical protein
MERAVEMDKIPLNKSKRGFINRSGQMSPETHVIPRVEGTTNKSTDAS